MEHGAAHIGGNAVDGNTETWAAISGTTPATHNYIVIDLGSIYYDIDYVKVIHPASAGYGRTYYGTKTEISEDGVNWTTIFDSAVEGTYAEGYNRGTEPLQTLPAQWWNWFINKFTARFNKVNIYVKKHF